MLDRKSSSSQLAEPGERLGLGEVGVEPGVALDQQPVGVGEPVHVGVVAAGDQLVERAEGHVPRHRLLVGLEQEERLDGERDPGQDAEGAEADPRDLEDVGVVLGRGVDDLAGAGHQLQPGQLGGQAGGHAAGAVGAGRRGAGQGLLGDVAHVVQ